jgi:hypothetical protein
MVYYFRTADVTDAPKMISALASTMLLIAAISMLAAKTTMSQGPSAGIRVMNLVG